MGEHDCEKALRLGFYAGIAVAKLGDDSYARQFIGRDIADVSEAEYLEVTREIHHKLLKAGIIRPDEDPFEEVVRQF
jgi:hypothetical protein